MAVNRPREAAAPLQGTLLTLAQAAEYLGLSQTAFEAVLHRNDIASVTTTHGPRFSIADLDLFLDNQRARAVITGKLTMSLPMQVDVPALLRTMVTCADERQAAEALASEVTILAGACCKATIVLRIDDATERVRLVALSDFPGRERLLSASARHNTDADTDLQRLPETLQQAFVKENGQFETVNLQPLLTPVMGAEWYELVTMLNLRSTILFPLLRIGATRWIVALLLDTPPSDVDRSRRDAVEALAVQASVALDAVRLRDDVLHRATRAEALYSTARMLARSEDLHGLLERIASLASRLLNGDAGTVLIYHPNEETFSPGASIGLDERAHSYRANLSSTYLVGRAAAQSGPLQVRDASQTATLALPSLTGNRRTLAAICAPIIHGGEMLGAIEIYSATPRTFSVDDTDLLDAFSHQAAIALQTVESQEIRRRALFGAVEALASANEARDGYTGEHCRRLAQLAMLIARACDFSEQEIERIGLAAALHDIGKIAVPDAILRKPGPLTEDERAIIQLHPATGQEIVGRVPELQDVALMIGAHQERWDGMGYPNQKAGEDIPLGARIIAVVDTYAALVEDRPYRAGATHEAALAEIVASSRTQFDPDIVRTFVDVQDAVRRLMNDTDLTNGNHGWLATQTAENDSASTPDTNFLPGLRWQIHRASELAALNDIVRMIATTHDMRRMYDLLYRKLSHLIDVDAMLVLQTTATSDPHQEPRFQRVSDFPAIGNPAEAGIVAAVTRGRRPIRVDDYQEFARSRHIDLPPIDEVQIPVPRSIIAAPIVVDDEFLGILTIQALHPNAYEKRHIGIIEELSLHLGVSMRSQLRNLRSDTDQRMVSSTHEIAGELETQPGLSEATRVLAQRLHDNVPYDGCIVFIVEQGELAAAAVEGYYSLPERRAYQTYRIPRGGGILWGAIEEGATIVTDDLAEERQGTILLRPPVPGESAMAVPLVANGSTLGVIFVTRLTSSFNHDDETRLTALARASAQVLTGFQQRDREQQRVEQLMNLQKVTGRLAIETTLDNALETVVQALGQHFNYRFASIYLREDDWLTLRVQTGYDKVIDRIPLDKGILARCVRTGTSALIADVRQDPEYLGAIAGITSEIAVPIVVDGQVVGGINVEAGRERQLNDWDLALIELLAQQLGITLDTIAHRTDIPQPQPTGVAATIDQTTSLSTQSALMATLTEDIERFQATGEPVALLFLDLDHFKHANDAYGHRFGDELMGWLGDFLPRSLPPEARIARYAGDAFVVTLPGTRTEHACAIAESLRSTMAAHTFETSLGHQVLLSISVGVAGLEPDSTTFDSASDLLHAADRAMYAAKRTGRNRVVCWSREL